MHRPVPKKGNCVFMTRHCRPQNGADVSDEAHNKNQIKNNNYLRLRSPHAGTAALKAGSWFGCRRMIKSSRALPRQDMLRCAESQASVNDTRKLTSTWKTKLPCSGFTDTHPERCCCCGCYFSKMLNHSDPDSIGRWRCARRS